MPDVVTIQDVYEALKRAEWNPEKKIDMGNPENEKTHMVVIMKKKKQNSNCKSALRHAVERIGESKFWAAVAIIITILSVPGLFYLWKGLLFPPEPTPVEYLMIDSQSHHIGDVNNSYLFPEAPNNEGNFYINHFNLSHKRERMYLTMKTRDIDPDVNRGPAQIFINNRFACYLNSYVDVERREDEHGKLISNFANLEIPISTDYFKVGQNNIIILVGEAKEKLLYLNETGLYQLTFTNIDDNQFWDLQVKLEGKKVDG